MNFELEHSFVLVYHSLRNLKGDGDNHNYITSWITNQQFARQDAISNIKFLMRFLTEYLLQDTRSIIGDRPPPAISF